MKVVIRISILMLLCAISSPAGAQPARQDSSARPPVARIEPKVFEEFGHKRIDNYYWLRDRDSQEVIDYIETENKYLEKQLAHIQPLRDTLFEEIKGRLKPDDSSVPFREGDYYYNTRYEEGQEYPIYARRQGSADAPGEVMIDANQLAAQHEFFALRDLSPSTSGRFIAFAVDTTGRRIYTIQIKDLATGEMLDDVIPNVTGNLEWANDDKTVFYSRQDPETLRWYQIYRHTLGTPASEDVLVYQEDDVTFDVGIAKTRSDRFLVIVASQTLSTEYRVLDANHPEGEFTVVQPRERDLEYHVSDQGDYFIIRTNLDAPNFRLMRAPIATPGKEHWEEIIPHREDVFIEDFDCFADFLVVTERKDGLIRLQIRPADGTEPHYVDFGEPTYLAYVETNRVYDTNVLRYAYTSMTTPYSVFDYDMVTREKELMKETEVLGGFDKRNYTTKRIWATVRDGERVPISLVYRNGYEPSPTTPLLLYGYGSYGYSIDATFSSSRLSLLDRGMTFAVAHIRGGQELGRRWYEDGKLLKKKNTFYDFIDCAEFLEATDLADPNRIFAMGGSAGGLLIGAVVNMRPDLFKAVVADVPFVDVVTTMLDESIPLTTGEYDEWGNPNDSTYYEYMLSYSPYDNVEAQEYPAMLVTAGLHDSQVQYWEPTKWVAKLRALKKGDEPLLLHTNMDAGHGGQSGRYRQYWETAMEYGFLLDQAGYRQEL